MPTPALTLAGPDASQRAALAAALLAVDPPALGGAVLRALRPDRVTSWLDALRALLPPQSPMNRVPTGIPDDRLLGGLDLAMTLATGRPVAERGLLVRSDGGVLVLPSAERVESRLVGRLVAALDARHVPARIAGGTDAPTTFALVAIDEGEPDETPVSSALVDRLAFTLDLSGSDATLPFARSDVATARALLPGVTASEAQLLAFVQVAEALGVASLRAVTFAVRAARAAAALDGRTVLQEEDIALAATLVLGPRATRHPAPPDESDAAPPPSEETEAAESDGPTLEDSRGMEDRVIAAVAAMLPVRLESAAERTRRRSGAAGRAGSDRAGGQRGRQVGTRRGDPRAGGRLDLLETLRAAAPWQRLRASSSSRARVQVRADDFRLRHLVEPAGTTAIFVVDASGSAAVQRLGEAKGAVELLLADAYSRRDEVGLVAFRGTGADVLLPPTRAIAAAKRALAALPGGGGTPLAHAIDKARELVQQARRGGNDTVVVFLTDARANIARDGSPGRPQAEADAMASARALRALGGTTLFIDTAPRPSTQAQGVAAALGARYVALPRSDARGIHAAVRSALPERA
ncbi:MAG: magnesium chelatase subunit D [Gemmatimonadaceae bacterium]|nr:magnesium chelatase subunit D [Gemmatimonadaceae bacterium]